MSRLSRCTFFVLAVCSLQTSGALAVDDGFAAARKEMIEEIQAIVTETRRQTDRAQLAPEVMAAMGTVPRHEFVPEERQAVAYANRPLPVGHGQTISQPYIVALMTDLLEVDSGAVVFEIGTGSGYQAAVLAELVRQVYTMEIVEPLALAAKERLARLGYGNVEARFADGYYGWPEKGPFDAIIVTAAVNHIPPPLVEQLAPGGRLVLPVGERFAVQHLLLLHKLDEERVTIKQILPVRFVPLTGGHD
jgi:protein-L-isoaspartate(D-aspartate) O-methyltransferase